MMFEKNADYRELYTGIICRCMDTPVYDDRQYVVLADGIGPFVIPYEVAALEYEPLSEVPSPEELADEVVGSLMVERKSQDYYWDNTDDRRAREWAIVYDAILRARDYTQDEILAN